MAEPVELPPETETLEPDELEPDEPELLPEEDEPVLTEAVSWAAAAFSYARRSASSFFNWLCCS